MAIKCDNCDRPAVYTTAEPSVNPAHYCSECLPHWLQDRAFAGHFPLMEPFDQTPKAEVIEEPAVVEEPKPKKKAASKATTDENNK